ncbi:hypothetical protein [Acinetobacter nosocomialis]|uniref:hypothetical protein n=1 Tax=Acinetobacter nosocomialis TaxID=106654 RepID=UPI00125E00EF|nr:hypothetical protein [Acinetobacter nosocomialis]
MNSKALCLQANPNLYCKSIGAGMFQFYQIFEDQYFFANSAKTEKAAWDLALKKLEEERVQVEGVK